MSITWKADVYVTQDGKIIELPFREEFSISELEDMEKRDRESTASFFKGVLAWALGGAAFWTLVIWRITR